MIGFKLAVAIGAAFALGFLAVVAAWIEHERDVGWAEVVERNEGGVWEGRKSFVPETIKPGF